jgi:Phosphotransferase enzyme family
VKLQAPEDSRRERLRTEAGGRVGRATGLFVVPEIVAYDDARGEISFQKLQLMNARQALSQGIRGPELLEQTGRALAAIHGCLPVIEGGPMPSAADGPVERRQVPLHGDFGMRNVFWVPDQGTIAIIDWANADWIGIDTDRGAPEIDLAVFLISLFHRRMFGPWPLTGRHQLARRFLAAYAGSAPHGLDLEVLREVVAGMTPAFSRLTRQRKGRLHALGSRHAMIDLQLFLRRYSNPG